MGFKLLMIFLGIHNEVTALHNSNQMDIKLAIHIILENCSFSISLYFYLFA